MSRQREVIRKLARAVMSGPLEEEACVQRLARLLEDGRRPRWLRPFCRRLIARFGGSKQRIWLRDVGEWIRADAGFVRAWIKDKVCLEPQSVPVEMSPSDGAPSTWKVPPVMDLEGLADLLGMDLRDLEWLSRSWGAEHYLYRWHQKARTGAGRLIEIPKPMLKRTQRSILSRILERIPTHEASHGFQRGRSVHTYVKDHTSKAVVLRMDLRDFFPSIGAGRVESFFLSAGYPELVAKCLTKLVTHCTSWQTVEDNPYTRTTPREQALHYLVPHLPQGAPTSPALANLCAFRLDCRLAGLARKTGVTYTRYADDLLFSGEPSFARRLDGFQNRVLAIILEEGFSPNYRKTQVMRASQRQAAGGMVINSGPNLAREEWDRLKAILHNCQRFGPVEQNRDGHPEFRAHLQGRIAWVRSVNAAKGEKLQRMFEEIQWPAEEA